VISLAGKCQDRILVRAPDPALVPALDAGLVWTTYLEKASIRWSWLFICDVGHCRMTRPRSFGTLQATFSSVVVLSVDFGLEPFS
jgi:hypothetical protein